MTTRGFGEAEFKQVAHWIDAVLRNPENEALKKEIREAVSALTQQFPL